MRVTPWGARGSVPVPDAAMLRHGGNTSCVEVAFDDDTRIVLDAGTGIRRLGAAADDGLALGGPVHVLLTHLHLDHIQGLLFFPPLFDPGREIVVWGPPSSGPGLRDRLARYLSAPLSPIEMRDLPADVSFRSAPTEPWRIGSATVRAAQVAHRGVTLGYRIEAGGSSLCYLPDHEPALGAPLGVTPPRWISGHSLACRASLLIHDAQYFEPEYRGHLGWGHSSAYDATRFAHRAEAERVLHFHHDPSHDDASLDELELQMRSRWEDLGHDRDSLSLAVEGRALEV